MFIFSISMKMLFHSKTFKKSLWPHFNKYVCTYNLVLCHVYKRANITLKFALLHLNDQTRFLFWHAKSKLSIFMFLFGKIDPESLIWPELYEHLSVILQANKQIFNEMFFGRKDIKTWGESSQAEQILFDSLSVRTDTYCSESLEWKFNQN